MNLRFLKSRAKRNAPLLYVAFMLFLLINPQNVVSEPTYDNLKELRRNAIDNEGNIIISGETDENDLFIAKYDSSGNLIWQDTFGGSDLDILTDLFIDHDNNIIMCGYTKSSDFEVLNPYQSEFGGSQDFFLRKWSANGLLLWSTYFGGSGEETITLIKNYFQITSKDEIILLGQTTSDDIAVSKDAFQRSYKDQAGEYDFIVAKFSKNGNLVWSSYLGTPTNDFATFKLDSQENIIIRGNTESRGLTDSITPGYEFSGVRDPYLVKIDPDGHLIFSLYFGGSAVDYNFESIIDSDDNILMLAPTYSTDFPIVGTAVQSSHSDVSETDLTISKFKPSGTPEWSTYFGGNGKDDIWQGTREDDTGLIAAPQIILDKSDNFFLFTQSSSTNLNEKFPEILENKAPDAINLVVKFSLDDSIIYGRFFSGSLLDFNILSDGGLVVSSTVDSSTWPLKNPNQSELKGTSDIGLAKLSNNGTLEWSSYLGGSSQEILLNSINISGKTLILSTTSSLDIPNALNQPLGDIDLLVCQISENGINEWCRYVGTEGRDSSFGDGLVINQITGNLIIFGYSKDISGVNNFQGDPVLQQINSDGELQWSQIVKVEARVQIEVKDALVRFFIPTMILSICILFGYIFRVQKLKSSIKLAEITMNESMEQIISPIFENTPKLIYLFSGIKNKQNVFPEGFIQEIPSELMDYTYLLHPVRMSIVKLLTDTMSLTTIQLKDLLNVSWNDINPHVKSLKKKGYITVNKEFAEGQLNTVIRIEPIAITKYQVLKSLLMEFFDATPNIERYIQQVNKWHQSQLEVDLYPKENRFDQEE